MPENLAEADGNHQYANGFPPLPLDNGQSYDCCESEYVCFWPKMTFVALIKSFYWYNHA